VHVAIDALILRRRNTGVQYCVADLVRALGTLPGEDRYTVFAPPGVAAEPLARGAVTVRLLPRWARARPLRVLWEQMRLRRAAARVGADLLHAPAYIGPLRPGLPLVLTVYDTIALDHPGLCARRTALYFRAALRRAAAAADLLLCPSHWVRDRLGRLPGLDAGRIRVVPPGVAPLFRPQPDEAIAAVRRRYRLPERYVLFVGNIEPKKNLGALAPLCGAAGPESSTGPPLVVAGQRAWKWRAALGGLADGQPGRRVHFLGYVPRGELPALYAGAELFLFPSRVEGFGLPVLEAMACGTPVVAARAGALPETAGGGALLVDPDDPAALAAAVASLLDDPARRRRMVSRGKERAAAFSWQRAAEATRAAYREAVGSRGTSR
jgi:glycosyltransferase involved in cell wall biosynthesis